MGWLCHAVETFQMGKPVDISAMLTAPVQGPAATGNKLVVPSPKVTYSNSGQMKGNRSNGLADIAFYAIPNICLNTTRFTQSFW